MTPGGYELRARIWPLLLIVSPLLVLAVGVLSVKPSAAIGSASLGAAALFLGAQVIRDAGKRLEVRLFAEWGGPPTRHRLQFSGPSPKATFARRHVTIAAATGIRLPTEASELADPTAAAATYDHATLRLRELTRDRARFALLFSENVNYGFRRNLTAARRAGQVIATASFVAAGVTAAAADGSTSGRLVAVALPGLWSVLALATYAATVNDDWVRSAAETYADRLLGAAEVLAAPPSP